MREGKTQERTGSLATGPPGGGESRVSDIGGVFSGWRRLSVPLFSVFCRVCRGGGRATWTYRAKATGHKTTGISSLKLLVGSKL
jgi:hypothetical protein